RSAVNFFRQRDYAGGIEQLTYQVAQKFASEYHFTLETTLAPQQPAPSGGGSGGFSPIVAFFLIFIFVAILSSLARGRGWGCYSRFFPCGGFWGRGGWGGGVLGGPDSAAAGEADSGDLAAVADSA